MVQAILHERQHKLYVTGITSLWLLAPTLLGASARPTEWAVVALTAWSAAVCGISTLAYWFIGVGSPALGIWREGHSHGKLVYDADRVCAPLMFVALVAFFATGHGARPLAFGITLGALPASVAVFFLGSRYFETARPNVVASTACHLTFRYAGYWWVYLALTPPEAERLGSGLSFVVHSSCYWAHILYSVVRTGRQRPAFQLTADYGRGCVEVLLLLAATLCAAHAAPPS